MSAGAIKAGASYIDLSLRSAQFTQGLKNAAQRLKNFSASVQNLGRTFAKFGATITAPFLGAAKLFADQEKAERRLESVLRATGNAAGLSADELKAYASELQSVTTYGDEAIMPLMAIIATFREIKGDHFKEATELALDMATVLRTDAKSAAIQLGKALNDPKKGITALTRSGVKFSEEQKINMKKPHKSTGPKLRLSCLKCQKETTVNAFWRHNECQ